MELLKLKQFTGRWNFVLKESALLKHKFNDDVLVAKVAKSLYRLLSQCK